VLRTPARRRGRLDHLTAVPGAGPLSHASTQLSGPAAELCPGEAPAAPHPLSPAAPTGTARGSVRRCASRRQPGAGAAWRAAGGPARRGDRPGRLEGTPHSRSRVRAARC